MQVDIPKEFDFERECRMMTAIRQRLEATGLDAEIKVPRVVGCLGCRGMIVQQRMEGAC